MDDDELMNVLQEALATPRVMPVRAVEAARAAGTWVSLAGELAELVYDSAQRPELAGVRGPDDGRELTWQAGELSLECRFDADGLAGEVLPPGPARVLLRSARGGERELAVDDLGRFTDAPPADGPLSLRVTRPGVPELTTPWLAP